MNRALKEIQKYHDGLISESELYSILDSHSIRGIIENNIFVAYDYIMQKWIEIKLDDL